MIPSCCSWKVVTFFGKEHVNWSCISGVMVGRSWTIKFGIIHYLFGYINFEFSKLYFSTSWHFKVDRPLYLTYVDCTLLYLFQRSNLRQGNKKKNIFLSTCSRNRSYRCLNGDKSCISRKCRRWIMCGAASDKYLTYYFMFSCNAVTILILVNIFSQKFSRLDLLSMDLLCLCLLKINCSQMAHF